MNIFIFNISIPIDQWPNLKEQTHTGETGSENGYDVSTGLDGANITKLDQ